MIPKRWIESYLRFLLRNRLAVTIVVSIMTVFFAYETTNRRLASTRRVTAISSPSERMRAPSARSSSTVRRANFAISRRYAASVLASSLAEYRFGTRRAYYF